MGTPTLKNDRLLRAIRHESVDYTPIWIMRQAGRYLPEYRATRARAGSFMKLCKTPELACEVTLQPLQRFPLDASIIFSDILTIPDAMGMGLEFAEGRGPYFTRPLESSSDINRLAVPDLSDLGYVYDAIRMVQRELAGSIPLIGFCGSPWTLAAYVTEGQSKNGFPRIQAMVKEDPKMLHKLLDLLAQSVAAHLNAQIEAGVQVAMIFDTWGGMLDTDNYQTFSLYYVKQVIANLKQNYNSSKVPVILFTKGGNRWLKQMITTGCDALGVDWEISLADAKAQVGQQVALQGNMNPASLLGSPDAIREEVSQILASFGKGAGHIFNLGHGITPDVPPENVAVLVEAVHELSRPYHV